MANNVKIESLEEVEIHLKYLSHALENPHSQIIQQSNSPNPNKNLINTLDRLYPKERGYDVIKKILREIGIDHYLHTKIYLESREQLAQVYILEIKEIPIYIKLTTILFAKDSNHRIIKYSLHEALYETIEDDFPYRE